MANDILEKKSFTISYRNLFDIGLIAAIGVVGYQVSVLKTELNGVVSLMEATSAEATKKIQQMGVGVTMEQPEYKERYNGYQNTDFIVGKVGALKVTEKLSKAFGGNIKIVVNPDKSNSFYNAQIGSEEFIVTGDGEYLIVDGVYIPLNEKEYAAFRKSQEFNKVSNKEVGVSQPVHNTTDSVAEPSSHTQTEDKLSMVYPGKKPGLNISHDSYQERLKVFTKAKEQAIHFEGVDSKHEIFAFFDTSCPSCRKFFESVPVYLENGFDVNIMLIDKSRKYESDRAKEMMSIYCEKDRKAALIAAVKGEYTTNAEQCDFGRQYIESMTNAALLVGTIGTPSLFTPDAIPIYDFNDTKGNYSPIYRYSSVTSWMKEKGYL